jgi:hypothetical protein
VGFFDDMPSEVVMFLCLLLGIAGYQILTSSSIPLLEKGLMVVLVFLMVNGMMLFDIWIRRSRKK